LSTVYKAASKYVSSVIPERVYVHSIRELKDVLQLELIFCKNGHNNLKLQRMRQGIQTYCKSDVYDSSTTVVFPQSEISLPYLQRS